MDEDDLLLTGGAPAAAAPVPEEAPANGGEAITLFGGEEAAPEASGDAPEGDAGVQDALLAAFDEDDQGAQPEAAPAAEEDGPDPLIDATTGQPISKKEAKAIGGFVYKQWKKRFGGDAAATGGGDEAFMIDGRPMTKAEAKAQLEKSMYKQWKKKFGGGDDGDKKADKKDKKSKKEKSSKKGKSKRDGDDGGEAPRTKRKRRETGPTDDAFMGGDDDMNGYDAAPATRRAPAATRAPKTVARGSALANRQKNEERARSVVNLMETARKADKQAREAGRPPLYRIKVLNRIDLEIRRAHLHEFLVDAGVLNELAFWLFDPEIKPVELAPLDLRCAALELLSLFELEGVVGTGTKISKPNARADDITYEGINSDQLRDSIIGKAVNFVRTHPDELKANRNKAVLLLQNLSRAYAGVEEGEVKRTVKWGHMDDPEVGTPFDPVVTATEVFTRQINKVDPLDPDSYHKVPPTRIPQSYITTLYLDPKQLPNTLPQDEDDF